jgi:hypothetical protein
MDVRGRIVEEAKTWLGVKFKHAGRDRFGVDCVGLVIKVAHALELSQYDTVAYPHQPDARELLRGMREHLEAVPLAEAGHGDVAIFRGPQTPVHCGIIEVDADGEMWVIHAYAPARKVVRERMTGDRDGQWVLAFRYTGN